MRNDLSNSSRLWVYQAERSLEDTELSYIKEVLSEFCPTWTAHDIKLKADFDILFNRFVILVVDETQAGASGCSIDKSVKKMQEISAHLKVDFFNRLQMVYMEQGQLYDLPMHEVKPALSRGDINTETLFFNPLIQQLSQLSEGFLVPFKQHWLNK